ncbi:WW domain-binding protein 1-like isoform X2 [Denticeps clupeoides]|nr:WW domain-binding protein 1-like isoform X2 [Denticeps clupeoides]
MTLLLPDGTVAEVTVSPETKQKVTASPEMASDADMGTISKDVKFQGGQQTMDNSKYCNGVDSKPGYLCNTGHCCGETGCCTYFYELWWFWLLLTVLVLFSCCCVYRHRRAKLRIQQQQRQREINLTAYHRACNYPTSMLDLSFLASFKLPSYEEVAAQPSTPPPPYSSVFALQAGAPYARAGPSGTISSQSSHSNYTSCSCESCSLTSPSSTSFSVQVVDETDTSNASTPSDGEASRVPSGGQETSTPAPAPPMTQLAMPTDAVDLMASPSLVLSDSLGSMSPQRQEAEAEQSPTQDCLSPRSILSPPKHALFSPNVDFFEPDRHPSSNPDIVGSIMGQEENREEEEEEEDPEENHFSHRRLTGDSGIEVCRCQVKCEEEDDEDEDVAKGRERGGASKNEAIRGKEEAGLLHDSVDCSVRAAQAAQSQLPPEDFPSQRGPTSAVQGGGDPIIAAESS